MLPYTVLWDGSSGVIAYRVHILPVERKNEREKKKRKKGNEEERKVGGRKKERKKKKIEKERKKDPLEMCYEITVQCNFLCICKEAKECQFRLCLKI